MIAPSSSVASLSNSTPTATVPGLSTCRQGLLEAGNHSSLNFCKPTHWNARDIVIDVKLADCAPIVFAMISTPSRSSPLFSTLVAALWTHAKLLDLDLSVPSISFPLDHQTTTPRGLACARRPELTEEGEEMIRMHLAVERLVSSFRPDSNDQTARTTSKIHKDDHYHLRYVRPRCLSVCGRGYLPLLDKIG